MVGVCQRIKLLMPRREACWVPHEHDINSAATAGSYNSFFKDGVLGEGC